MNWPDPEGLVLKARGLPWIPEAVNIEVLVEQFYSPVPAEHDAGATALRAVIGYVYE